MRLPWQVSDLHPHALSLDEDALRPDFGDALREDLSQMSPPDIIQRYRCVLPEGAKSDALISAGFHAVRLTRMVDLPVGLADDARLTIDLPDHIAPHWFLPTERAPWGQWLAVHWQHYQAVHVSNPPREPVNGLRKVFIGDDLLEGLALREGPQGRVMAFASLRKEHELGWIGGAPELLPCVLGACLRRAAAIGWSIATAEVDNDDTPLWDLIEALGVAPSRTYVTWHRERDPARRPN